MQRTGQGTLQIRCEPRGVLTGDRRVNGDDAKVRKGVEPPDGYAAPCDVRDIALPQIVTARWCHEIIGTPEGDALVRANVVVANPDPAYDFGRYGHGFLLAWASNAFARPR
jgi:hypothetical protein